MTSQHSIRMLAEPDISAFVSHLQRQVAEAGNNGLPISHPHPKNWQPDIAKVSTMRRASWLLAVGVPSWRRTWAADMDGRLVGHGEIFGGSLPTESHRCTLGLAVEQAVHRRGIGDALMTTIIGWARQQPELAWIDLGVFSENTAARALYRKHGFKEIGVVCDRFRVDGTSIDDVQMALGV